MVFLSVGVDVRFLKVLYLFFRYFNNFEWVFVFFFIVRSFNFRIWRLYRVGDFSIFISGFVDDWEFFLCWMFWILLVCLCVWCVERKWVFEDLIEVLVVLEVRGRSKLMKRNRFRVGIVIFRVWCRVGEVGMNYFFFERGRWFWWCDYANFFFIGNLWREGRLLEISFRFVRMVIIEIFI